MSHKSILIVLSACFSIGIFAQETKKNIFSKLRIQEAHLQNGFLMIPPIQATQSDFIKLAPNSSLLQNDLSSFAQNNGKKEDMKGGPKGPRRAPGGLGSSYLGVYLGLSLGESKKESFLQAPVLRLGFNLNRFSGPSASYFRTTYTRFDTLQSSQSGAEYTLDSALHESYAMGHNSTQLGLDIALIFQTSDTYRWGIHGGLGINACFDMHAETRIKYTQTNNVLTSDGSEFGPSTLDLNDSESSTSESFSGKKGSLMGIYFPIGVDFRIGKEKEFWRHVYLYLETRPGVYISSIPGLKTNTTFGAAGAFGLKVNW